MPQGIETVTDTKSICNQKGGIFIADAEFQKKKRFLIRYVKLKHHIDYLEERLYELDKDTGLHSPNTDGVGSSSNVREYQSQYDLVSEMEDRINRMLKKSRAARIEICDCIDSLEDTNEATVLEKHFIDDLSFFEIAAQTNYTQRWVEQLYASGMNHIEIITF